MGLMKRVYTDQETLITAENLNEIQDAIIALEAISNPVIGDVLGPSISVSDASDLPLWGLSIYGKTTQNGTPTPDTPVELVSIGGVDSITVNVAGEYEEQSISVVLPNDLSGIPVSNGGNYTDENGQQWICDEIDFARGVRIQRCFKETVLFGYQEDLDRYSALLSYEANTKCADGVGIPLLCETLEFHPSAGFGEDLPNGIRIATGSPLYAVALYNDVVLESATVLYPIATPIETPLSATELAAYASLHTYRGNTTVSNDAGAWMAMEYVMDTKKYIDSLLKEPPARLSYITLHSSAWVGDEGLYSQVVTIDGITKYSKVDLLPSVEQLAIFHDKDLAFVTENEDGVVTVFAIGDKPILDYTVQAQITEVKV